MGENFRRIIISSRVRKRQHRIRGLDRRGRENIARTVVREGREADCGGLRAIEQVPDDGRAKNRVVGVDRARIQDCNSRRSIPMKRIDRIRVLRQPALDGLDLARTEARQSGRVRAVRMLLPAGMVT